MVEHTITHTRHEITITKIGLPCPICKKRVLIEATCGHPVCQYKQKILTMRKHRKTEQIRNTRKKI